MDHLNSAFSHLNFVPPVENFKLRDAHNDDRTDKKINLSAGAYRDDNGKPWVLPVVRAAEAEIASDPTLNHEYLPVTGSSKLCELATELCLGKHSDSIAENRARGVQTLGSTGALRIAAEFLYKYYYVHGSDIAVCYSDPTWPNHDKLFRSGGFSNLRQYRYWDAKNRFLDIEGMLEDFNKLPERSIVILHACAHNPTGVDPTKDQWCMISDACKSRNLFPVFDFAYQGLASGDPDEDAWCIRMFERAGFEFFVCQSFSKNFGLYNERVGNLVMVLKDSSSLVRARSHIEWIIRGMYSNPPCHGARVVTTVLSNPAFYSQWRDNIRVMSHRIKRIRQATYEKFESLKIPGIWDHIVTQSGMFSYTGLSPTQCEFLTSRKHIYLLKSGRISMCGLTDETLDYFAQSVSEAVTLA